MDEPKTMDEVKAFADQLRGLIEMCEWREGYYKTVVEDAAKALEASQAGGQYVREQLSSAKTALEAARGRIAAMEGALENINDKCLGTPPPDGQNIAGGWIDLADKLITDLGFAAKAALTNDGTGIAAVLAAAKEILGSCGSCGGRGTVYEWCFGDPDEPKCDFETAADCPTCTPLRTALEAMEAGDAD